MGQKVNPNGLRVGVIKNWDSRWFAKDNVFGDLLVEDYKIRKDLKKRLYDAGVPAIEIERKNDEIKIMIQCARPGMVVGRGGEGKSPIGRPSPVTPWGKPAMGYKTRKKNHRTDKQIARRRNGK